VCVKRKQDEDMPETITGLDIQTDNKLSIKISYLEESVSDLSSKKI
jgi:hypothetical protein